MRRLQDPHPPGRRRGRLHRRSVPELRVSTRAGHRAQRGDRLPIGHVGGPPGRRPGSARRLRRAPRRLVRPESARRDRLRAMGGRRGLRGRGGRAAHIGPAPPAQRRSTRREGHDMTALYVGIAILALLLLVGAATSIRILKQYERGVQFRLGRVKDGARGPGLIFVVPLVDRIHRVSLRIVTMPIQSQGIITRDNVSVDVSAVAYYRVEDAVRSVVAIENVAAAINQIAQTTLRAVVGRHTLDQTLSETDTINQIIREILDVQTEEWGVKVTVVELKDIQLPESMKRAMARQAEAEREKRAKIIAAQGEALAAGELGQASDVMMAHPLALQLRNLQTMVEIGVDKNSTIVFPAPLMSTIQELGAFLARESAAASTTDPEVHTNGARTAA